VPDVTWQVHPGQVYATVVTMHAASGAHATLSVLIVMNLLVILPGLEPYPLTRHLSAYADPVVGVGWMVAVLAWYAASFATVAMVSYERKDF